MASDTTTGYAPVNGMQMYYESRGHGGTPLVVVHGGYGSTSMFGGLLDELAEHRQVIAIELQGHGHTRDVARPFTWENFGDDVAELTRQVGGGRADLLGYSLGGSTCLRAALQHPELVRRLVVVSSPFDRDGWYPEVLAGFDHMDRSIFEQLQHSPMYEAFSHVNDSGAFLTLIDKTGELLRRPYDWTGEVETLPERTLLVYADADSIPVSTVAEYFKRPSSAISVMPSSLLGGGLAEPGWEGEPGARRELVIIPGRRHYDILESPVLLPALERFLSSPD